ncbi:hypothetical protein MG293_020837 [Ovis ammon polii]|uniref:Uncharacterized protein n=1 Tax=Ovis ammon polii TaxID=230172 RepID=A0AAD4TJY3_OVIAM|nr:hypothetical protein MG293_020837 [Ovis ammon polii]
MEITERLENHPQEVVILACRNFDGMMEDLHKYLMGCIKNISGDMLCPCEDPDAESQDRPNFLAWTQTEQWLRGQVRQEPQMRKKGHMKYKLKRMGLQNDLPLKEEYENKLKRCEKEQSVYGNEMKGVIIFKMTFLKACEFDYIVRCLKSKTRPLDFVLEVITKDTNFNIS